MVKAQCIQLNTFLLLINFDSIFSQACQQAGYNSRCLPDVALDLSSYGGVSTENDCWAHILSAQAANDKSTGLNRCWPITDPSLPLQPVPGFNTITFEHKGNFFSNTCYCPAASIVGGQVCGEQCCDTQGAPHAFGQFPDFRVATCRAPPPAPTSPAPPPPSPSPPAGNMYDNAVEPLAQYLGDYGCNCRLSSAGEILASRGDGVDEIDTACKVLHDAYQCISCTGTP